jgi:hypothetical protein
MKTIVLALLVVSFVPRLSVAQQQRATKSMSLTAASQLTIATISPLPLGYLGQAYSVQFTATGGTGTITWSVAAGSTLPAGLTLSPTGLLSGTLTTAGTCTFSVMATDSGAISNSSATN